MKIDGIGKVNQVGYVVPDIETAMKMFSELLGVGPWFCRDIAGGTTYWHGKVIPMTMRIALANSGNLQVELIQDTTPDNQPSFYKEFLRSGRQGINHVSFWQDPAVFPETDKKLKAAGWELVCTGETGGPTGRFAYYQKDEYPGIMIETSSKNEAKTKRWTMVAEAHKNWDGSDPIRYQ